MLDLRGRHLRYNTWANWQKHQVIEAATVSRVEADHMAASPTSTYRRVSRNSATGTLDEHGGTGPTIAMMRRPAVPSVMCQAPTTQRKPSTCSRRMRCRPRARSGSMIGCGSANANVHQRPGIGVRTQDAVGSSSSLAHQYSGYRARTYTRRRWGGAQPWRWAPPARLCSPEPVAHKR